MKATMSVVESFIKSQLRSNRAWALRALIKVYANQTSDEQNTQQTKYVNNIGFTGADAELLSSFAEQYQKYNRLSEKQMALVFKKIPKYWQQIWNMADQKVIIKVIEEMK